LLLQNKKENYKINCKTIYKNHLQKQIKQEKKKKKLHNELKEKKTQALAKMSIKNEKEKTQAQAQVPISNLCLSSGSTIPIELLLALRVV
jgi:predicted type IV restriction endonuclease